MRPNWDQYFLGIATAVAERSDCRRSKVGAVLVDGSHRILSTGYVGVAPGELGCLAGGCPRGLKSLEETPPYSPYDDCISTHAEINAWAWAKTLHFVTSNDMTMYVTRKPCDNCNAKILGENGTVVFLYPEKFCEHGIRWDAMLYQHYSIYHKVDHP